MAVVVTKPEINVRSELADLRKPTGIAGEAMLRAETPQEQFQLIGAGGNRNMIINGAMNVAQRATSVAAIGANTGYFTLDRWRLACADTAGRLTASQTADGPNGISANCLKLDCTTADTSIAAGEVLIIQQLLEGQNLQRIGKGVAGAKQITVSFYAKANAAFTFVCQLADTDNGRNISKLFNVTTDWVRQELTFAADVDDGSSPLDDNNATSFELNLWLHAGANYTGGTLATSWANNVSNQYAGGIDSFYSSDANNFFITGVQMEVGPIATEFEQEQISTTLAKCQRYFQRYPSSDQADSGAYAGIGGYGFAVTTTALDSSIQLPVTMRLEPTMSPAASGDLRVTHENTATAITAGPVIVDIYSSVSQVTLRSTVGSEALTVGAGGQPQQNNDNDAHISLDAEL
mgnify:FL=1